LKSGDLPLLDQAIDLKKTGKSSPVAQGGDSAKPELATADEMDLLLQRHV